MAIIAKVDYEAMPGQAQQIRSLAQDLNNEMVSAYQSITDMHGVWYGKRYNDLVVEFNNLIPQMNEMLDLVVAQIPFALETAANNYSQVDTGTNVVGANRTEPRRISDIAIQNDVGMRFLTSEVNAVQQKVSTNFKTSEEKMNSIQSVYGTITWISEASEAFEAKFTKLKGKIVTAFQNLDSQFVKLMKQAQEDIQATENANTVQ